MTKLDGAPPHKPDLRAPSQERCGRAPLTRHRCLVPAMSTVPFQRILLPLAVRGDYRVLTACRKETKAKSPLPYRLPPLLF